MSNELSGKEQASKVLKQLPFTVEPDFSYFVKHDELIGVIPFQTRMLPSIEESCYTNREEVFGPSKK